LSKNCVVFDLEIKNPIATKEDWKKYAKMGISVGCSYDFSTGEYGVYMDDNLQELVDLINGSSLVTGFNIQEFDLPLLRATAELMKLNPLKPDDEIFVYDIYRESKIGAGADKYAKGFNLDAHLKATFGEHFLKTAHGSEAPVMWQNHKYGKLVDYCLADVHRERMLFEHIWYNGSVKVTGMPHLVKRPQVIMGTGELREGILYLSK
jgi:hypothetical protein